MAMAVYTPYTYCTEQSIIDILGEYGLDTSLDDNRNGINDPGVLNSLMADASLDVDEYIYGMQRYSPQGLQSSPHVARWTSVIAAYRIRSRRGQSPPEILEKRYEEVQASLRKVQTGQQGIPGVRKIANSAPNCTNLVIQQYRENVYESKIKVRNDSRSHAGLRRKEFARVWSWMGF